jgi:DNA-binding MurR/RpiR family transcriptional regulator
MSETRPNNNHSAPLAMDVIDKINGCIDALTPSQKIFAQYVLQNPESLAFLSINDLARKAGVSVATIMRFSHALGYSGFAQLARETQQAIQAEIEIAGRFQLVQRMSPSGPRNSPSSAFERILKAEIDNLINLPKHITADDFFLCIDAMVKADRICIIGCLASTSLAIFFGDMLSKILNQVDVIHGHGVMTSAVLARLTRQSVVFLISFPRYPRTTTELGRQAARKGARIITLSNSLLSSAVPLADLTFTLPVGIPSLVDAYAGPMVFINALVTELSEQHPQNTRQSLTQYDRYAASTDLFQPTVGKRSLKAKERE